MEKTPEIASPVAVVLPPAGMVTATVIDVRHDNGHTVVRVRLEHDGNEIDLPVGAVQPLN